MAFRRSARTLRLTLTLTLTLTLALALALGLGLSLMPTDADACRETPAPRLVRASRAVWGLCSAGSPSVHALSRGVARWFWLEGSGLCFDPYLRAHLVHS